MTACDALVEVRVRLLLAFRPVRLIWPGSLFRDSQLGVYDSEEAWLKTEVCCAMFPEQSGPLRVFGYGAEIVPLQYTLESNVASEAWSLLSDMVITLSQWLLSFSEILKDRSPSRA